MLVLDAPVPLGHRADRRPACSRDGACRPASACAGRPNPRRAVVDQCAQLALAGDDVGEVQPAELVLLGQRPRQQAEVGQAVEQPVVERPLVLELQRADAVGDVLQRVLDRVRVGVHRIDAPAVAGVVVRGALDAVQRRVAQVDVGRCHVDLGAQHQAAPSSYLAVAHLRAAARGSARRAAAERAVGARRGEVAAAGAHLLRRLFVDVGQARLRSAPRRRGT